MHENYPVSLARYWTQIVRFRWPFLANHNLGAPTCGTSCHGQRRLEMLKETTSRFTFARTAPYWLTALAALVFLAVVSQASATTITSSGPILSIEVPNSASLPMSCAVNYSGWGQQFYGTRACGTYVLWGNTKYAPGSVPAGSGACTPNPCTVWTVTSSSGPSGSGTALSPYCMTHTATGGATLTMTETDCYVTGNQHYRTTITLANSGGSPVSGVLWRAGDCYMNGVFGDNSYGLAGGSGAGSIACTENTAGTGRVIEWIPHTAGSTYMEDYYSSVWNRIGQNLAFANSCGQCPNFIDSGAGLSWQFQVAGGSTATFIHDTRFGPQSNQPPPPPVPPYCSPSTVSTTTGTPVTFTVVGTSPYSWSSPGGSPSGGSGGSYTTSYSSPGTYTVTVTDASGNSATCTVYVFTPLVCSPGTQTVYTGAPATFTASGGNPPYSWSSPSGSPPAGSGSSHTTTYATPGTYAVWVSDASGNTAQCVVNVIPPPCALTGRAFIAHLHVEDIGGTGYVGPTDVWSEDTGPVWTTNSERHWNGLANITGPLIIGDVVAAEVKTFAEPECRSEARSSVVHLDHGFNPPPGLAPFHLRLAEAWSRTSCTSSEGDTTIAYLMVGGVVIVNTNGTIPPNTQVVVGPFTVTLNEQVYTTFPGGSQREVNAVHVTMAGGFDLRVLSATSDIHDCPQPTPPPECPPVTDPEWLTSDCRCIMLQDPPIVCDPCDPLAPQRLPYVLGPVGGDCICEPLQEDLSWMVPLLCQPCPGVQPNTTAGAVVQSVHDCICIILAQDLPGGIVDSNPIRCPPICTEPDPTDCFCGQLGCDFCPGGDIKQCVCETLGDCPCFDQTIQDCRCIHIDNVYVCFTPPCDNEDPVQCLCTQYVNCTGDCNSNNVVSCLCQVIASSLPAGTIDCPRTQESDGTDEELPVPMPPPPPPPPPPQSPPLVG